MHEPHPVRWKSMIGLGIVSVLLGLFMLFFANSATQFIVVIAGFSIILLSAIFLVEGLCIDAEGLPRWGILGLGIVGLILGVLAIAAPTVLVISTGLLLGAFLIVYGIGEVAIGVSMVFVETMVRMVFIVIGIISMVIGIFLIINPTLGVDIFVWLVGFYLVILGLMRVAHGFNEREAEKNIAVKRL